MVQYVVLSLIFNIISDFCFIAPVSRQPPLVEPLSSYMMETPVYVSVAFQHSEKEDRKHPKMVTKKRNIVSSKYSYQ